MHRVEVEKVAGSRLMEEARTCLNRSTEMSLWRRSGVEVLPVAPKLENKKRRD